MAFKTFGYVVSALTYGAIPFNIGMIVAGLFIMSYVMYGGQKVLFTVPLFKAK